MEEITIVGVDLAKNVFQIHAANSEGRAIVRKRLPRTRFLIFMSGLSPCVVAMEACATSHYWARELRALGHEVRLIPPIYVKPFVKRQKNDANDAEAITEAALRPSMRTVPMKSSEQQALAMLFRTRELLLAQKTQLVNALRAHLAEHGVIVSAARRSIAPFIKALENTQALPDLVRTTGAFYLDRITRTVGDIKAMEQQIDAHAREQDTAQRLRTIPGVGPITSMAVAAFPLRWRVLPEAEISRPGSDLSLGNTPVAANSAREDVENGAARHSPIADQRCDVDHTLERTGGRGVRLVVGTNASVQIADGHGNRFGQQDC